jgi:hypothetical protein
MFWRQLCVTYFITHISSCPYLYKYAIFLSQLSLLDCLVREVGGDKLVRNFINYLLFSTVSYTGWSRSLCAPVLCTVIFSFKVTFWSPCTKRLFDHSVQRDFLITIYKETFWSPCTKRLFDHPVQRTFLITLYKDFLITLYKDTFWSPCTRRLFHHPVQRDLHFRKHCCNSNLGWFSGSYIHLVCDTV